MSDVRRVVEQIGIVGVALLLGAAVAAAQPAIFSAGTVVSLPSSPGDTLPILALADVGSAAGPPDGNLDLVTADQTGHGTVVFGNGDGTFGMSNDIVFGRIPAALVLAEFDGVAGADMVMADINGKVVFLHGNNDGSFNPSAAPVATIAGVTAMVAVDVNHDNKRDVVVLSDSGSGGGVTVLIGDGNGGFTAENPVALAPGSAALTFEDFNGDRNVDLAVANRNTSAVTILLGDGTGQFTLGDTLSEGSTGKEPLAITAGDLNGDGHVDLVVADHGADDVAVFLGLPAGKFQAPKFFASGTTTSQPNSIAVFDANQDGKLDVAVSNNFSSDVSVLLGDGTGSLGSPRGFVTDQEPLVVAAGLIDKDQIPDLMVLNKHTQGASSDAVVLLGQGDGGFRGVEHVATNANPTAVTAGDVDNDGLSDVIVAHGTGTVLVHRALAGGGFAPPVALQSHGDAVAIGRGDFNADGQLDIVAANRSTSDVSVFLAQHGGLPSAPLNFPTGGGAVALAVGDWNGDGRSDLAVAREGAGDSLDVLLAKPDGTLEAPSAFAGVANPVAMDVGDFNNDRKLDLVVLSSGANAVSILRGNGDGTFQPAVNVPVPIAGQVKAVAVADFDGDGYDDIAVMFPRDAQVIVLYGSAQGSFTAGSVPLRVHGTPSALVARDLNGDLLPDLAVTDQVENAVIGFLSRKSRTFQTADDVTVGRLPTSIVAADFDGDGRYDGATSENFVAGAVSVLTNILSATPILRGDGNGDRKVSAADVVAVTRKLGDGTSTRVEQVGGGAYAAGPGADANGDGVVTSQDIGAVLRRLFPRI